MYAEYLAALSDDDFQNERYTVTEEAELIGMSPDEYIEKRNACEVEAHRRWTPVYADA